MNLPTEKDRISVCVCTFKRPAHLSRLLEALSNQVADDRFVYEIVIVDNDSARSSEPVARSWVARSPIETVYACEPEQNISLARNSAIRNSTGNLIAFIDDDECPSDDWLMQLYRTLIATNADGVLGPVLPDFPSGAPTWLKRGGVFRRRRLPTGTRITEEDARTGNLLLRRSIVADGDLWFDPAFGRTGGEDTDFFARQFLKDRVFVWCDEAAVDEVVPPDRWTTSYHVKRLLRAGTIDGEWMRVGRMPSTGKIARNAAIFCACVALTPPAFLLPKHLWMRILQKLAYSGGVVSAYWGMSMLRYRDE